MSVDRRSVRDPVRFPMHACTHVKSRTHVTSVPSALRTFPRSPSTSVCIRERNRTPVLSVRAPSVRAATCIDMFASFTIAMLSRLLLQLLLLLLLRLSLTAQLTADGFVIETA